MVAAANISAGEYVPTADHRIVLADATWEHYEQELAMRGEKSVPRLAYLEEALELMSPSRDHERITSWTSGGIDKLAVYQRLGIDAVWFWIAGRLEAHALRGDSYKRVTRCRWLPGLDEALRDAT